MITLTSQQHAAPNTKRLTPAMRVLFRPAAGHPHATTNAAGSLLSYLSGAPVVRRLLWGACKSSHQEFSGTSTPSPAWPVVVTGEGSYPLLWASRQNVALKPQPQPREATGIYLRAPHRTGWGRHIGPALLRGAGYVLAFLAFTACWYWLLLEVVSDDRYWK